MDDEVRCKNCGYEIVLQRLIMPDQSFWRHKNQYGIDRHCLENDFTKLETVAEPEAH
jgi:hypothetical protein